MSDEKPPSGFSWGLRPGGGDEPEPPKAAKPDATGASTAPVDVGHFSVVDRGELAMPDAPAGAFADDGEPTAPFDFRAPAPPRIDSIETPVYHAGRSLPWEQPPAFDPALEGVTEALAAEEAGLDRPAGESAPSTALESLFAADRFRPYDEATAGAVVPFVSRPVVPVAAPNSPASGAARPPRPPMQRSQRVLMWVAGGLVAALAVAGLFFVGTRIGDAMTVAQAPTPVPTAAPDDAIAQPVLPADAVGPVAPGEHAWNTLLGTECLEPFESAWQEDYTVVECSEPHAAQLVYRGRFEESALDAFPTVAVLQARMNLLCASPENIDYAAAAEFTDIQISASFAGTVDDWNDGNRDYFCFVSRSSGEPLTASVAMAARPPVVIPVVPALEP
jgi:hypothetical protein